jgi:ESCRT-I complex subunit VPS28
LLPQVGLPATIEHRKRPVEGGGGGARAVAETVQHFITAMDSLKLNLVAVDQVGTCAASLAWGVVDPP